MPLTRHVRKSVMHILIRMLPPQRTGTVTLSRSLNSRLVRLPEHRYTASTAPHSSECDSLQAAATKHMVSGCDHPKMCISRCPT